MNLISMNTSMPLLTKVLNFGTLKLNYLFRHIIYTSYIALLFGVLLSIKRNYNGLF